MSRRVLLLALAIGAVQPVAAAAQAPIRLGDLEGRVDAHPAVVRARAAVDEARGLARQAVGWDNPILGVTAGELRPRESPSGRVGVFVEQAVTLGGKRSAARAAGEAEVERREAELAEVRLGVIVGIRRAWYSLSAAGERVRVLQRQRDLAAEAVVVSGQLFNVGLVDRSDVLLTEADAARAHAMLAGAEAGLDGARRVLAASAGMADIPDAALPAADEAIPVLDYDALRAEILTSSPALRTASAESARARADEAFARTVAGSDLFLRGEAGWNRERLGAGGRATGWEFGVDAGVSLPIANRNDGGIAAAAAGVSAASADEAALRLALEARLAEVFASYDRARREADAYRADVLPRAREAHAMLLGRYREMSAPYPAVLGAARLLADAEATYLEAIERARDAAVRLQGLLTER